MKTNLYNAPLPPLSEGCHSLEQLNISWCDQVTKDGIQALVRSCPGLKGLFLKGCTQVPIQPQNRNKSLQRFVVEVIHNPRHATSVPQLEDEALKQIGAHCPELVTLNLQTCSVSSEVRSGGKWTNTDDPLTNMQTYWESKNSFMAQ